MAGTLQSKFDRRRAQEKPASTVGGAAAAPADVPISEVYTQWVGESNRTWVPGQAEVADALMTIGFQVRVVHSGVPWCGTASCHVDAY